MRVALLLFCAALMLLTNMTTKRTIAVRYETLTSPKIDRAIRMVLVSDLHNCRYGENQSALLKAVALASPDLVVCTGDIFDAGATEQNAQDALRSLAKAYPCYYVMGNHESAGKRGAKCKAAARACGVTVLEGTAERITVNGQSLLLCGVDDGTSERMVRQIESSLVGALDGETFAVLLCHRPEHFNKLLAYGFDLMLSGHTHGGQWRIPLALNGVYAPGQGWFPKYAGGCYDLGAQTLIVSRGLSKKPYAIPRFGNPPELVSVTLAPYEGEQAAARTQS